MKKLFGICLATLFVCTMSFAQEANTAAVKKDCTPTKECAAKMGMTLEQCKSLCQKTCNKSGVAAKTTETSKSVAGVSAERNADAKACCSIEECAKKMGMTVEECLKVCNPEKGKNAKTVASAVMEKDAAKKTCCKKAGKKCTSKS